MSSRLDRLRQRVTSSGRSDLTFDLYLLIKELKCLPEVVGREFEVEYEGDKVKRVRQLPMKIPTLITLMEHLERDYKEQQKQTRKMKRK